MEPQLQESDGGGHNGLSYGADGRYHVPHNVFLVIYEDRYLP